MCAELYVESCQLLNWHGLFLAPDTGAYTNRAILACGLNNEADDKCTRVDFLKSFVNMFILPVYKL